MRLRMAGPQGKSSDQQLLGPGKLEAGPVRSGPLVRRTAGVRGLIGLSRLAKDRRSCRAVRQMRTSPAAVLDYGTLVPCVAERRPSARLPHSGLPEAEKVRKPGREVLVFSPVLRLLKCVRLHPPSALPSAVNSYQVLLQGGLRKQASP